MAKKKSPPDDFFERLMREFARMAGEESGWFSASIEHSDDQPEPKIRIRRMKMPTNDDDDDEDCDTCEGREICPTFHGKMAEKKPVEKPFEKEVITDIYPTDDGCEIVIEAGMIAKEDFHVEVDNSNVRIFANPNQKMKFDRTFPINFVPSQQAKAKILNGILTVSIVKKN
jgi:HSP20 family molecular chaperone IbpA